MFNYHRRLVSRMAAAMLWAGLTSSALAANQVYFPVTNCINMGNGLEAPTEGEWGYTFEEQDFKRIQAQGFDTVRIPIKWSAHMDTQAPYAIHPAFLSRVDQIVNWGLSTGLNVIINVHHFDELYQNPDQEEPRLIAIWEQLANHYRYAPPGLLFEIINEPYGAFSGERVNTTQGNALAVIRKSNPTRTVILAGDNWGDIYGIDNLRLPNDPNVVATVHYYTPFEFTHQGAEWLKPNEPPLGRGWPLAGDLQQLSNDVQKIVTWRNSLGVPVLLGEYGTDNAVPMDLRGAWAKDVTNSLKQAKIPACYFNFAGGFAAYDKNTQSWHKPITDALQLGGGTETLIYEDALQPGWSDWSWSTLTTPDTQHVKTGANGLAVQYQGGWAGLTWRFNTPLVASNFSDLRFWVYGSTGSGKLQVYTQPTDTGASSAIFEFTPTPNAWMPITVPMSALGNPAAIARVNITDGTGSVQPKFYLDQVRFSGVATPKPSDIVVYEDTRAAGVDDWSWNTLIQANTQIVKSGASSLAVKYRTSGAGLVWRFVKPVATTGYAAIRFWVYGSKGSGKIVAYTQSTDTGGASKPFAFTPKPGAWQEISVPLSALGSPAQIARINIQDNSGKIQPVFYLDQVRIAVN